MLDVRPIEDRHVSATADLVARAMHEDPAYCYLFNRARSRHDGLTHLFDRNLRLHLSRRCTYVGLEANDRVVATVTVRPPNFVPISTMAMLRRGLMPFAVRHGIGTTRRLFWLKGVYDALESDLASARPHWYIHMMAVVPERQGRGLGTELLDRALALTAADSASTDIVLTTQLPQNVTFYRRAAFTLAWERSVHPPNSRPYSVWGMRRSPHPV